MKKRFTRHLRRILLLLGPLLALILVAVIVLEVRLQPVLRSMAESRARSLASKALNSAISENLGEVNYSDLVSILQDEQGRVVMLQANSVTMNKLASAVSLDAQQRIADLEEQNLNIPLGNLLGKRFFAGKGPKIRITVQPSGSTSFQYLSEFSSAGINQTLHSIKLQLSATIRIMVRGESIASTVSVESPICESVILGTVPESYTNVPADILFDLQP